MNKLLLTSLLLIISISTLKAQQNKIYIEEFMISDQIIHGQIDDKYPITAYLKFEQYSPENWLSFSVSGWYYYDNVKTEIPLVGIYYAGGITLYSFTDKLRTDSIKRMISTVSNPMEITDELTNRSGFSEKIELSYSEYNYRGIWKNNQKELNVTFNTSSIYLDKHNEFLVLPLANDEKKYIDLDQFGLVSFSYSIFVAKKTIMDYQVILRYSAPSTANPNGMCGAGMEIGFMLLKFDLKGNLLEYRTEDVESCLGNLWSEMTTVPNSEGMKVIYKVTDSEEKVRTVTVDGLNFSLVSK
ncbi:hypothetical protein [Fluviicola taffensis]|uniref:Uncharacterized protein n=1 Tax=Fluviicola taffensis (strain DSM 16823 / NCIMB 13979 / RW262) TaxID=755732 RepID=F2IB47_FLUTR|nr:hypothetical protein [Fluviicola taffensis]AEA42130.1 hypothetical protein Fluta_0120 [Fluviicola taffensis DSM 16823]